MDEQKFTKLIQSMTDNITLDPYEVGKQEERDRILKAVDAMEEHSHSTRTPIYQDTFFEEIRGIVYNIHPPYRFRDKANGE